MCRIAMLMPEKYHGFYRGHPRIAELRKELQLPLEGYPTTKLDEQIHTRLPDAGSLRRFWLQA